MKPPFVLKRRITFAETDLAGVLHFSNYYRLMEEVEHAYFRSLGISVVMRGEGQVLSWPRVSASCDFFSPLRFEDEVELRLTVTKLGNKSLSYEVVFFWGEQECAVGRITAICCEMRDHSFESVRIPDSIRESIGDPDGQ